MSSENGGDRMKTAQQERRKWTGNDVCQHSSAGLAGKKKHTEARVYIHKHALHHATVSFMRPRAERTVSKKWSERQT